MKSMVRGYSAPAFDQGIFLLRLNKGREHLQRGDVVRARLELEEGLKLRPRDEMVLNLLGMVYFRLDLRREAIAIYRNLLAMHPEADILHSNLGILEFKEGRHEEASIALEEALKLNPRNPKPHLYLGLIARLHGRDDECLDHLRRAGADALIARIAHPASETPAGGSPSAEDSDTNRMRRLGADEEAPQHEVPSQPEWAFLDLRDLVAGHERRRSLVGESLFALKSRASLEIAFLGKIRVHRGEVFLASGDLEPSDVLPGFSELHGPGRVLISRAKSSILLLPLSAQRVYVSEPRLLAWEGSLDAAPGASREGRAPASVRLGGSGSLAVDVGTEPLVMELRDGHKLRATARRIIAWTDEVRLTLEPAGDTPYLEGGDAPVAVAAGEGQILIDAA